MEKYLDNQDFIRINTHDGAYFANSEDDEIAQIMYDYGTGTCYINSDLIVEVAALRDRNRYSVRLMQAFRKLFLADTVCFTKGKNENNQVEVYISAKRNGTTIVWADCLNRYP